MAYQELLSATAVALGTRPDGTLRTLIDPTTLLYDSFETLDTTNTWVIGGTVTPTGAAGQLTVAPGTTANASSFAKSQPAFIPSSNGWLVYASLYQLETGVVTGNKRVWGLGTYITPTFAVPITNGVVFEIDDVAGGLQASVYSNSVRTTVVTLTRPTDGLQHRYSITYRGSRAYFDIDGVTVTTIQNPNLQVSALSLITVSFNGATVIASAPTLISTLNGLGDSGRNATKIADGIYPWRVQTVKAASTAALLTDLPAIVALHPGSPTPNFLAAQAVTGPLTDTQIRATPLAVSGLFFQTTQPVSIASMPSTPVTGIFFQTTQPVSGAFFQATQPVSIAAMPTTPVTGTFFQATQPISATALPLPTGAAQDGTDITTPFAMPTGGLGIRGWLSAIWTKLNGSLAVTGTFFQATQPVSLATNTPTLQAGSTTAVTQATAANLNATVTQQPLTKGTQGAAGVTTQDLKDAGRNQVHYYTVIPILSSATDTLQSLTGTKAGVTVTSTTTPAVVTTGKTFRITRLAATYIATAVSGYGIVRLRFQTAGVATITSPIAATLLVGAGAPTTANSTASEEAALDEGWEFAAGVGIGISVQGFAAVTPTAVGYVLVSATGYEY